MAFIDSFPKVWRAVGVAFLFYAAAVGAAYAQQAPINDNALVTIRFNQARVYYDQQLYSAISKAVTVKPSVTFDVISYAPETGDSSIDEKWQQVASAHTQAVVASMEKLGVPLSRMRVTGQHMGGIRFDEVHVIAR